MSSSKMKYFTARLLLARMAANYTRVNAIFSATVLAAQFNLVGGPQLDLARGTV
jgi:hypothetical protein